MTKLKQAQDDRDHWCHEMLLETVRADKAEHAESVARNLLELNYGLLGAANERIARLEATIKSMRTFREGCRDCCEIHEGRCHRGREAVV